MGIKDIISQAKNKLTFKLNELTYDKDAEKAALQADLTAQKAAVEEKAAAKPGTATPAEAKEALIAAIYKVYGDYVLEWQRRAQASRQFPQAFVNNFGFLVLGAKKYDKELQANPTKELFQQMIDQLAATFKAVYVEGKYKGDLNLLAMEIDRTKPTFPGSAGLLQKLRPPSKTAVQKFTTSFLTTFTTVILFGALFFICILAGSLAANDAIGRAPAVRFVYFVYGAIPFFSPFVLIYYIWRYWKGTYPIFYNMLPLTNYMSDYWIINTVLWPFFFYKDANVDVQAEQFVRLGKALIWNTPSNTNANTNNTNANNTNTNNTNNTNANANNANANNAKNAKNANANNTNANANNTNANAKNTTATLTEEQNDKIIDAVFNNSAGAAQPKPATENN